MRRRGGGGINDTPDEVAGSRRGLRIARSRGDQVEGAARPESLGSQLGILPPTPRQSEYREDDFLVGGRSAGPGETVIESFKLHEGYAAQCSSVVKSRIFPYEYQSDLFRHAIVRHLEWLASLDPEAVEEGALHQMAQMQETAAWHARQIRYVRMIDEIATNITGLLEFPGGRAQAGAMLWQLKRHMMRMRKDFYRALFEQMFEQRFGAYLASGIVLLDARDDDEGLGACEDVPEELLQEIREMSREGED